MVDEICRRKSDRLANDAESGTYDLDHYRVRLYMLQGKSAPKTERRTGAKLWYRPFNFAIYLSCIQYSAHRSQHLHHGLIVGTLHNL